jgi:hypothetical protein
MLVKKKGHIFGVRFDEASFDSQEQAYRGVAVIMNRTDTLWIERRQHFTELPLRGPMHPFMFQTGDVRMDFGPFVLSFNGPACVSMYPLGAEGGDYGFSFASTAWKRASQLNPADGGLRWYRVDLRGRRP